MDTTIAERAAAECAKRLALMARLPNLSTPTSNAPSTNRDSRTALVGFNRRFRGPVGVKDAGILFRNPSRSDKLQKDLCFLQRPDGRPLHLQGMYEGSSLFMVLSGPSLKETPLHLLGRRGLVTMGVNNSWLMWKPDLWVSVDPPGRFADVGWLDPRILKICPQSNAAGKIRTMVEGSVKETEKRVCDCPNVAHFVRQDYFDPKTFWTSPYAQWGCLKDEKDALGIKGGRSVMLVALKTAYWLGFKKVFLLGADFKMSEDSAVSPYGWDEKKDDKGRRSNNRLYKTLSSRFQALVKSRMPLEIYNCTKDSGLKVFPYMDFEEAVQQCESSCEREVQTKGWYVK